MKKIKKLSTSIFCAILSASMVFPSIAAGWQQNTTGWWWQNDDKTWPSNAWVWLDGNHDDIAECYYFGPDGYMLSNTTTTDGYTVDANGAWTVDGVVQTKTGLWKQETDGRWYYENADGTRKANGWYWIDGNRDNTAECYYFGADGYMLAGTTTPDGYTVDANGAWTVDGVVQTKNLSVSGPGGPGGGSASSSGIYHGGGSSGGGGGSSSGGGGGGSSSGGGGSSSGGGGSSSGGGSGNNTSDDDSGYEDDQWNDYEDGSVSGAANDFTTGNWGMMTSDQRTQVTEAIDEFKAEYITDDMSEFEKEIAIIKWIVENCEYEAAEDDNDWSMATAYSVMIEGKGQCAGYADAFLQMAKACGLDARYVYNNIHAWNLVKLDGDWYHVDVTWEDPIGSNDYGDSGLRNYYINLTDDEIKEVSSHKTWSPSSIKANGTKYDYFVVKKYLETGEVDVNVKDEIEEQFKEELKGYETINYSTVDDAAGKIVDVLKKKIDNRDSGYKVAVIFNDLNPLNATDSLEAYDRADQIEEKVNATINAQYGDVLFNAFKLYLFRGNEKPYKKAFVTGSGSLRYKEGYGKMVDYKIHFIDTETGEEVGIQEGSGELNRQVEYKFPEHYVWISNLPAVSEITSGSGRNNGKSFTITSSSEAFEMNLKVRIDKNHYTIQYIDKNNEIISTQSGCEDKGVTISFKLPEGYSVSSVDADKDQIKLNEDNFGTITGFTLKADRKHVSVKVNLKNEVSEDTTEKEPISENLINSITNATKAEAATPSTPKR